MSSADRGAVGAAEKAAAATDLHVYLHLPFCRIQCPYCTFFTVLRPQEDAPMLRLLRAVQREWSLRVLPLLERGARLRTLYCGGGTPSDLPTARFLGFLKELQADCGGFTSLEEVTIECNPESATPDLLDGLLELGVNRISLGVQALDEQGLRRLGRGTTLAEVRVALSQVAERFRNWNADLIIGIPGSTRARLLAALAELRDAGAPHLSFYCLEMPPTQAARLGDLQDLAADAFKSELYLSASAWATEHGYEHYEISNASKPGWRARHNTAYWTGKAYVGLGPGAHSYLDGERRSNRADLRAYWAALESGQLPPGGHERLRPRQRETERTLLGLRQREGLEVLPEKRVSHATWLEALVAQGLGRLEGSRLCLTPRGWLVSDSIVLQLLTPPGQLPRRVDRS